jgi:hypothetical protein
MVLLTLLALVAADDSTESSAKKMLPIYRKDMAEYSITLESAPKKGLELQKEPIHEWTNPVREGHLVEGVVFLWLREGRPAALGGIFSHPAPGWEGRKILHEFLALDREKLQVKRPNGNNQWTPQEGLERKELSDTAAPYASREARLLQMRQLAKEFTAHITDYEGKRVDLRLLPTPLYRYPDAKTKVVDGALFALVTTEGTDPEILLVLESREVDGKNRWEYACGRFGVVSMYAQHKGKEVWSSVLNGKTDVWSHDRLHLYNIYPEKIVTPEGKLLARMRMTPNGEEVILGDKK